MRRKREQVDQRANGRADQQPVALTHRQSLVLFMLFFDLGQQRFDAWNGSRRMVPIGMAGTVTGFGSEDRLREVQELAVDGQFRLLVGLLARQRGLIARTSGLYGLKYY